MNVTLQPRRGDPKSWPPNTIVVYDGACPFCTHYTNWLEFRENAGPIELLDARQNHVIIEDLKAASYNLDHGMVLIWRGQVFHGAEALNQIARLSSRNGVFNTMNNSLFSSRMMSRLLYPVFRSLRDTALMLKGNAKISIEDIRGGPEPTQSRFLFIQRGGRRQRREYPESARRVINDRGRGR